MPKRAKLFEFFVAVAVIGAVAYFLQAALVGIEEEAERLMVESTIRNVNTGVRFAQAQLIMQGRESEIPGLFSGSPARWLEVRPDGYTEVDLAETAQIRPGQWVWERQAGVLNYKPKLSSGLVVMGDGVLRWRWVEPGRSAQRAGLQPTPPYNWDVR